MVLDLSLGDGSTVTENVKRVQATGSAVLVHSIADRVASVREALAAGAAGVIPKSSATRPCSPPPRPSPVARCSTTSSGRPRSTPTATSPRPSWAAASARSCTCTHPGLPLKLAAQQLGIGYSTAREYLDRIRVKYVEVGRPAPTKVDLLRRAVEDGILPGLDPDGGDGR